jgi:hypothetical protein
MHHICLFCLLLLLMAGVGNAQSYSSRTWRNDTGKVYLRANLLGLIDVFDGNASFGGEYRINNSWSVTMDAGYIFYSLYTGKAQKASGILLRPAIRKYTSKYRNWFIDLQFHYKSVEYHIKDWLGKDVVNGVPTYEELKVFQYRKRVVGGQILFGRRQELTRNRRLFLEIFLGLGLHYKEEWLPNEPNIRYAPRNSSTFRNVSSEKVNHLLPAVPTGVRFIYRL